jgi:hypothetical protein
MSYKDMTVEQLEEKASQVKSGSERAIINMEIIIKLMRGFNDEHPAR